MDSLFATFQKMGSRESHSGLQLIDHCREFTCTSFAASPQAQNLRKGPSLDRDIKQSEVINGSPQVKLTADL